MLKASLILQCQAMAQDVPPHPWMAHSKFGNVRQERNALLLEVVTVDYFWGKIWSNNWLLLKTSLKIWQYIFCDLSIRRIEVTSNISL